MGTLDVVSSDHSGWGYNSPVGKRVHGTNAPFSDIPNGVPGLASRLPILFSEGVGKGRIDLCQFVRLTSSNPAKLFGLSPRKGAIAPGADADLVLWDPKKQVTITNETLQHVIDYTPYEGMEVTGWPVATIRRGEVAMRDGKVQAADGLDSIFAEALDIFFHGEPDRQTLSLLAGRGGRANEGMDVCRFSVSGLKGAAVDDGAYRCCHATVPTPAGPVGNRQRECAPRRRCHGWVSTGRDISVGVRP